MTSDHGAQRCFVAWLHGSQALIPVAWEAIRRWARPRHLADAGIAACAMPAIYRHQRPNQPHHAQVRRFQPGFDGRAANFKARPESEVDFVRCGMSSSLSLTGRLSLYSIARIGNPLASAAAIRSNHDLLMAFCSPITCAISLPQVGKNSTTRQRCAVTVNPRQRPPWIAYVHWFPASRNVGTLVFADFPR